MRGYGARATGVEWPIVKLSDVAEHCLGKMLDAKRNKGQLLPYLRNPNVRWFEVDLTDLKLMPFEDHELDRYGLRAGDVVICEGGEAGRAAIWDGRMPDVKFQKAIHRVRPGPKLLNRYLVHRLRGDYFSGSLADYYTGATIKHLTGQDLARYKIPLPPLNEQRRIADVLDRAEELLTKRRAALDLLDKLTQAIFLDMFGDPVTNPKGWPHFAIKALGKVITGRTPPTDKEGMFGGPIPFVTPGDLESGVPVKRHVTEIGVQESVTVRAGATLVCCIGATIGKSDKASVRSSFNQQINSIEWGSSVDDSYGLAVLRFFKPIIVMKGASTTLPILKKSAFERIEIPLPPIAIQRAFAARIAAIETLKQKHKEAEQNTKKLFQALQHKAFRGEL